MWSRREILGTAAAVALAEEAPDAGLPDFSDCGLGGGGVVIPDMPIRVRVKPQAGDATERIQWAIDQAAIQRGAVLLERGQYEIGGTLRISTVGVVLRGEGEETVLLATGTKVRPVIEIKGAAAGASGRPVAITDEVVPVGARSFRVASGAGLQKGQLVIVRRIGNAAWIHEIGMDRIAQRPGIRTRPSSGRRLTWSSSG